MRWLTYRISEATFGSKMPRLHDFPRTPTSPEIPPAPLLISPTHNTSPRLSLFSILPHRVRFTLAWNPRGPSSTCVWARFIQIGLILRDEQTKESPVLKSNTTSLEPASQHSGSYMKKRLSRMAVEGSDPPKQWAVFQASHSPEKNMRGFEAKGELPRKREATPSSLRGRKQNNIATYPTRESKEIRPSVRNHYCFKNKHKLTHPG